MVIKPGERLKAGQVSSYGNQMLLGDARIPAIEIKKGGQSTDMTSMQWSQWATVRAYNRGWTRGAKDILILGGMIWLGRKAYKWATREDKKE